MLSRLYIKNYVLVEELSISFAEGFQVITGETGAGKSILVDALSLALGARFDRKAILNEEAKCIIEVDFTFTHHEKAKEWLVQHEFDLSEIVTIRREVSLPSKTRSFINDTPSSLAQIQEFSMLLVDFHRQFDNLNMFNSLFELQMIDAYGQHIQQLNHYQEKYRKWKVSAKKLEQLKKNHATNIKQQEYQQHIFNELEKVELNDSREMDQLEVEIKQLEHSERIERILQETTSLLYTGESAAIEKLDVVQKNLTDLMDVLLVIADLAQRAQQAYIEWKDIGEQLSQLQDQQPRDLVPLVQIQERYSTLFDLLKKHQLNTLEELINFRDNLSHQLDGQESMQQEIKSLEEETVTRKREAQSLAEGLTAKRLDAVSQVQPALNVLLKQVGMNEATFKIDSSLLDDLELYGQDHFVYNIDTNGIGSFSPVGKIASGGELARVMLCLKVIVGKHAKLPSMIFDEVDSGISGDIAKKVGDLLYKLSAGTQILCVTHQPSIAAQADVHYKVAKQKSKQGKITTTLHCLSDEERVREIVTMMGDYSSLSSSLHYAEEMIAQKQRKSP